MALAEMGLGLNGIGLNGYWPDWELDQVALDEMALDEMGLDEVAIPIWFKRWVLTLLLKTDFSVIDLISSGSLFQLAIAL